MSNALREAVLHGEDFYNALLVRCRHTASLLGLAANPNFDAPDYSVRRAELRARTFTAWTSPVQLQSGALSFSKMSVQPNIQPPNSEEFVAAPAAAPSTSVGKIETGGELLATPGEQLSGVL